MCGELGENLATIAWGKLADYPEARVFASSFEKWPLEQEAFDLVVSATAFHWVDPAIRYRKSAQALRPAGSRSCGMPTTPEVLSDLHRRKAPELANERRPPRLERTADKAGEIEGSGLFERPEERRYRFGVVHDAESYLPLLGTFSSHRVLYEVTRKRLFAAVERLIDEEFGGRVVEGTAASST